MADYIYWYVYIEPSVCLWDEEDLIMMDDFVDMILNSIDNHFIEVFSPIHQGDWPLTFFFSLLFPLSLALWIGSLSSFGLRVKLALEKEFWSVPCFSMLWNSLRSIGISFSLKVWYNLSLNPYSSNLLWVGMFSITASISLVAMCLSKLFASSWFDFCRW